MRRFSVALFGILVLAVFAAGGNATPPPPLGVSFVVQTSGLPSGSSGGPFTAAGPAVDFGVVCPAGDTADVAARGVATPNGLNISIVKRFTCADGSGTFDVKLAVRIDKRGDNFNWTVVDGTGAYASLHGSGQGYGIYPTTPPPDVIDYYFGTVHG